MVSNDIRTKKLTLSDPSHIVTVNICHVYVGAQLFDLDSLGELRQVGWNLNAQNVVKGTVVPPCLGSVSLD